LPEPDMVAIGAMVTRRVAEAVDALPAPRPGASAYQIALAEGFEGDEATWLRSLRGRPGENATPTDRALKGLDVVRGSGQREIVVKAEWSDGAVDEFDLTIPSVIYRGVFDMAEEYGAGDMVTHRGSMWHCNESAKGLVPGTGRHWTLAVKKGADAR